MAGREAKVGDVVQGYHLQSVIAVGGMGTVFRAVHTALGRPAAVKVLSPALHADRDLVLRFLQEARIVNEVNHPNIVNIYDFVRTEDPPMVAFVMELLHGPPLRQVVRKMPFTPEQALNVTVQLASALGAVHRAGVVHRDLKPQNIIVVAPPGTAMDTVPSVKLLDFGIAKSSLGGEGPKTQAGSVMGTPAYMAPEQVASEQVSAATDLYALAEILFEMLSGRPLWEGDNLQILRRKVTDEIPPVDLGDVPGRDSLKQLITAGIAPSPADRPALDSFARAAAALRDRAASEPRSPPTSAAMNTDMFYRQIISDLGEPTPPEPIRVPEREPKLALVGEGGSELRAEPEAPASAPVPRPSPTRAPPLPIPTRDVEPRRPGKGAVIGALALAGLAAAAVGLGRSGLSTLKRTAASDHPLDWQLQEWAQTLDPLQIPTERLQAQVERAQQSDTWDGYARADEALRAALVTDANDPAVLTAYAENLALWRWDSMDLRERETVQDVLRHARRLEAEAFELLRAEARIALATEDRARARELLGKALGLRPGDVRARIALAEAADPADPERFRQDRAIDPELEQNLRAIRVQADLWARTGAFDRAMSLLDRRLRSEPNNGLLWLDRAVLEIRIGELEAAERTLQRAQRTEGVGPRAVLLRSRLARERGEPALGQELLESLLRQSRVPSGIRMEVGSDLAAIHLAGGRPDEALEVATVDNVEYAEARLQLGRPEGLENHPSWQVSAGAALLRGDLSGAGRRIRAAAERLPDSARLAAYRLAMDRLQTGTALDLSDLLGLDPIDPSAPAYATALDKELEERVFLAVRDQGQGPGWTLLGVLRYGAGRMAAAREASSQGEGPVAALYSGYAALALGDADGALNWVDRLQDLEPDAGAALLLKARALSASGRTEAAVRAFDQVLQQFDGPTVELERAEALAVHAPAAAAEAARALLLEHPTRTRAARIVHHR